MNGVVEGAFRRHYGHVYGYLRRRLGDPERAEELTQDVFAAAASALPAELPGDPPVLAWLYAVARRRFADEARRRGRERRLALLLPSRGSSEYEPISGALRDALAALPGGQSQVVLLKLVRGLTFAEIGAEVGLTEAAAKMRFVRALEQLRADLSERGIEP
ncbi:MAG TPA: RNA polymerase sigma factor [Gaiellaceae bacterium]